ncbi:uncharacterized protein LOC128267977 [Anopheles cruzii]|uniref:uncharacterized protein LOC128267977 n=1 Tax=Anopheles cruzii TaxID=68878 RepID=UPI0022EC1C2E|nr:uncharacterized protein LOC128267977 [Anopheles cruzii]
MDFKCPLCDSFFAAQEDLAGHVKDLHTAYYYDTYMAIPLVLNDAATIGTTATVITTAPTPGGTDTVLVVDDGGCCCCCGCFDGCCDDGRRANPGNGGDCDCDCDCCDCGDCGDCNCDCDCGDCSIM